MINFNNDVCEVILVLNLLEGQAITGMKISRMHNYGLLLVAKCCVLCCKNIWADSTRVIKQNELNCLAGS